MTSITMLAVVVAVGLAFTAGYRLAWRAGREVLLIENRLLRHELEKRNQEITRLSN